MKIELKTVFGDLIIEGDFSCMADAIRAASAAKKSLRYTDLRYTDLRYTDLRYADLRYADLRYADLRYTDLRYTDLRYADLRETKGSKLAICQTRILPEGSIIGWKQCRDNVIVKLRIPEEAKRSHAFGRKCRAEFVEVLEVIGAEVGVSSYNPDIKYMKGAKVIPENGFCEDYMDECAAGIHFFITRDEAEAYAL